MATIQAIEAKSVHQIQSGQVIVDLCSVVKELVENSLDASATSIEVRFKNHGLDAIEVQDNGSGINPSNYGNVALKHYTSKLSNYDDLSSLETFGFRGEAISSLCALSTFFIKTAQATEAPKGTRLEFDSMGALKKTSTVACQKGTIATVENLFSSLPVRRKELSKNIKREYGKVIGLLQAYACIGVGVKFTIKNTVPKGKSMVIFSTKGNTTTRDNIANVYGAKTLPALVALDLSLDIEPHLTQAVTSDAAKTNVVVLGHISKPVFGEGRQTPDRQLFFVNGRPCGLPQIAKAINEVYRSFNVSQSPFIFADFRMDTNAYDVNVSPDKRTILLHNAVSLIERLKARLTELFDNHEQTVPQSQFQTPKLPAFRQLSVQRSQDSITGSDDSGLLSTASKMSLLQDEGSSIDEEAETGEGPVPGRAFADHFRNQASTREGIDEPASEKRQARIEQDQQKRAEKAAKAVAEQVERSKGVEEYDDIREMQHEQSSNVASKDELGNGDDQAEMFQRQREIHSPEEQAANEAPIASMAPITKSDPPGLVQNAFDRMRPKRPQAQLATITIGDETTTRVVGTQLPRIPQAKKQVSKHKGGIPVSRDSNSALSQFSQRLQRFGAAETEDDPQPLSEEVSKDIEIESEENNTEAEAADTSVDASTDDSAEESDVEDGDKLAAEHSDDISVAEEADPDYIDDEDKKIDEDARVAALIQAAEETMSKVNSQRASKALKGGVAKDSTHSLLTTVDVFVETLESQMRTLAGVQTLEDDAILRNDACRIATDEEQETRLSLTVSKADFAEMKIVGQFNLGFIIAVRHASADAPARDKDELFIVDQHASDEKFNFERLQAETTVGNQRMVKPVTLDLTAVEEEIVLENQPALEKNGFIIEVDTSGIQPVGRRCTLLSLPLSKEVVFDTRDLDELIHLLSEAPMLGPESTVPRPSRVRKMFAMRACRSSIMIGKTLSKKQMKTVVSHMGTIDKPWNCPHGRPTMRHLTSLNGIETWNEGDGTILDGDAGLDNKSRDRARVWGSYLSQT
ncbi:uncharacterized protein HMPREF1541_07434 [Cyphellophora europaea CBS 101466]|uniref:DNA mismatch repair protein PMS1 n=1 Tax=Cyphellophora europaea (strain CBS 101466) TaxID=1220924 RepID=W2RMT0_CYPE1|nr:uncharacterized protein HMPREF1541_07434 [Cyphellophora europaea CBS 101466]ETN37811.1 hypothetical protein HMPREF1541_07434 [Cyphellophora europaea CBS 101466]